MRFFTPGLTGSCICRNEDDVVSAFRSWDANGDGQISFQDCFYNVYLLFKILKLRYGRAYSNWRATAALFISFPFSLGLFNQPFSFTLSSYL